MSNLDLSDHPLNRSTTKQKYSFPKTQRFRDSSSKPLCQSFYDVPSTFARRTTSLGYGKKTMGLQHHSESPGVGKYHLQGYINPQKNMRNSISFGLGRDNMQISGPYQHLRVVQKIPAPGFYKQPNDRDNRAPSLRSRLPDPQSSKNIEIPGPGSYDFPHLGANNYYISSKYKNFTNIKISKVPRLDPLEKRRSLVGPGNYQQVDSLNKQGRYSLSKHFNVSTYIFDKSQRQGIVQNTNVNAPGPGQYNYFSGFG